MKSLSLKVSFSVLCMALLVGCSTITPRSGFFNVREYGAKGDGKALDHIAINQAIEACAAVGGGTVWLPAGTYLCGSIHLKSNIHLLLDAGSTILGAPQNLNAYDPEESWTGMAYQDGGHTFFHNSLIWGENLTNISITGPGTIHGGGLSAQDAKEDDMDGFNSFGKGEIPAWRLTNSTPAAGARWGNKAIALKLCRNVLLRDFTILHGGHFAVLVTGCDNLTVDNVTMDTDRDGIDLDCCRNSMVSNCRINSPNDDALCPKSSFALGRDVITENMTIVNCQVSGFKEGTLVDGTMKPGGGNGRIKFGTEANGGFRNITVANCTFRDSKGLALEEVDGGILENITIQNLTMMDVQRYPIYITLGKRNRGPAITAPSRMRNILISGVVAAGVDRQSGIQITGLPEQPIENLRLENIRIQFKGGGTAADAARVPKELATGYPEPHETMPAYGLFARHAKNLQLANIEFSFDKPDLRPALSINDVDGLGIDNFHAPVADAVPPAKWNGVSNLTVRNSPGLDSATTTSP